MAVSTTLTSGLAEYIRVRSIEMWGPPASNLNPVIVRLDWTGATGTSGTYGKSTSLSDMSVGATQVGHLKSKPPKDTQIANWISSSSTAALFALTFPAFGIVDLVFDMIINDTSLVQQQTTVAGAVQGVVYSHKLDSASNSYLVPVSLPTI